MTIKEIMKIGTKGMNTAQRQEEQERRLKVAERITLLGNRVNGCKAELAKCEKGSPAAKLLNSKIKDSNRELNRIKAAESVWLREAAWFMYA